MIGKKNIVFGFLFLVLTAALGPYMVKTMLPTAGEAQTVRVTATGKLAEVVQNNYDDPETLARIAPDKLAQLNSAAILGINQQINARTPLDSIKGGPHAHGNLEALLNIAVGIVLCFVSCKRAWMKQVISWTFILGTVLHSGMLILGGVLDQAWAWKVVGTGAGPILLLVGLLLAGIAAAVGFRGEIVRD
ncbi:MAG: hypothetical protein A2Z44_00480 [Betaproteobacteria bacterium RBG_19FT_COMBO_58_11]|nr:MAG: hypothetical protein A2Z44_00480 [Betaproteobacteria bacterium RBG_19FT_COMBO_58_11]